MPKGILPWQMGRLLSSYSHLSSAPASVLDNTRILSHLRSRTLATLPGVSYHNGSASTASSTRHPTGLGAGRPNIIFSSFKAPPRSSTSRYSPLQQSYSSPGAFFQTSPYFQLQHRHYSDTKPKSPGDSTRQPRSANERGNEAHQAHSSSAGHAGEPGKDGLPAGGDSESIASSVSKYLHEHLPRIPHRPTKEELLAAATNFRQRLKVRFKWMSIRSMRPWNIDEWGAFVSWFMLGHLVWILVGTTTFFSLVILSINTVFAQGMSQNPVFFSCTNFLPSQKPLLNGLETILLNLLG